MTANARARDEAEILDRATFDLQCEKQAIQLTGLQKTPNVGGDLYSSYGARGCGKQATYVEAPDGSWVMNSATVPTGK